MASVSSNNVHRFQCILTNDPERASSDPLWFEQEEGKKSSFLLQLDDAAGEIQKPAHVILQGGDSFIFGGLEFVSNARNVEIYLTEDGKETYLTTSRGLTDSGDDPYRFKCIVVCPGGPRAVTRVHLKLLSLKPASCTRATLYSIKLKGRLLPPKQAEDASAAAVISSPNAETDTSKAPPGLTQADMGVAMTGLSMMVRSVESSLLKSVQDALDTVEKRLGARLDRIEQYLVMQQQAAVMQQQLQQQRFEKMQNQMMLQMKEHQSEMVSLITSLRTHVSQPKEQEEANGAKSRGLIEVKSEERYSEARLEASRISDADGLEGSSEGDASVLPNRESNGAKPTTESSTIEAVASDGNLNGVNGVGGAGNQEHAVAVALAGNLEQENPTVRADVRSFSEMNPIKGQAEPTVEMEKPATETEAQGREQLEISRKELREAPSILELELTEEESVPTDLVETIGEKLGGNDLEEVDSAVAGTNESNPEEEESIPPRERRPVMEKRDDALEIPDLLADLSNNEPQQADNSSETNQAADDSLNSLNNS